MKYSNRREFLSLASRCAALACLPALPAGRAIAADAATLQHKPLRDGAFLLSAPYANVLAVPGEEGLLLVDGVRGEDSRELLRALEAHGGGKPVALAYNTHWHYDHTGSNEALRESGAEIVAHENTRLWLGHEFYSDWEERQYEPRPPAALPTQTFYERDERTFAGGTVESGLLFQAHTDGDIYVRLPARNILAVGDLMADGVFPLVDPVTGGWIGALVKAQAALLELADEDTLIIPGSGGVQRRADLVAQHAMLVEMSERIYELARQGKGPREMLRTDIGKGFEEWGDPTQFVLNAYPGLGRHYREIDGVV